MATNLCCKLIADAMLGRLAKWLRLIGFDVIYKNNIQDEEVLSSSISEKRIILTRDKKLFQKAKSKNIPCIFINSVSIEEQLKQVFEVLGVESILPLKRCANCNCLLKHIEKKDVEGLVPDYIFDTETDFNICEKCKKIYWHGSHALNIEQKIKKILCEIKR
jgi:uncharacterized protein with PIN domain